MKPLDEAIAREYRFPCQRCGKMVRGDKLKSLALGNPLPVVKVCEACQPPQPGDET